MKTRSLPGWWQTLSRPEGNLTGVTFFGGSQLNAKRMELLHELVPKATTVAVFGDPSYPAFNSGFRTLRLQRVRSDFRSSW